MKRPLNTLRDCPKARCPRALMQPLMDYIEEVLSERDLRLD